MIPAQIYEFLHQFFTVNECEIVESDGNYLQVQLTAEMDKRIMNRPYYWAYIESTNETPNPARLTFITDQTKLTNHVQGEIVHYGSGRLRQLFNVTKEMGSYVKMYERVGSYSKTQTILTPWLSVNYKIAYCCDRTKEHIYSLGMNLMTGEVMGSFHELLKKKSLTTENQPTTFNLPYTIQPSRGLEKLDKVIDYLIEKDDHAWAEEAKGRWHKDRDMLEFFYEGVVERPAYYEVEKKAIDEQYEVKIKVDVINGGLFYLERV